MSVVDDARYTRIIHSLHSHNPLQTML